MQLPADSVWVWAAGLLMYDFCYYWLHRAGHVVALFWAAHVVHHQSQHYNLSTALRQTSSGAFFGWIFYLPMAIAGVPPLIFGIVALIGLALLAPVLLALGAGLPGGDPARRP